MRPCSGSKKCSGLSGTVSGVWFVDGKHANEPGLGVPPLPITNGRTYSVGLQLDQKDDDVVVTALVDGRRYYRWQGAVARLSGDEVWKIDPLMIGGWDSNVFFQSVQLKVKAGEAWIVEE